MARYAARALKHTLCRNKARALFLHARTNGGGGRGGGGGGGNGNDSPSLTEQEKVEVLTQSLSEARIAVELNPDDAKAQCVGRGEIAR